MQGTGSVPAVPLCNANIWRCPSAVVYSKYLRPCGWVAHSRLRAASVRASPFESDRGTTNHHCLYLQMVALLLFGLPFTLPIAFHLRTSRSTTGKLDKTIQIDAVLLPQSHSTVQGRRIPADCSPTDRSWYSNRVGQGCPTYSNGVFIGFAGGVFLGKSHRGGNRLLLT